MRHRARVLRARAGPGRGIERDEKALRRVVAVDAYRDAAFLVEKDQRRRELDLELRGELLLAHHLAIRSGDFAVAPDIERDRHEALLQAAGDFRIAEGHLHHALAVRAALRLE